MTPETMLTELRAHRPKDGPRFCVVHAAYDLPGGEVWLGGNVDDRALLDARVNGGSLNQQNGYLSEAYHLRPRDPYIRGLVVRRLRHQVEEELLEGEFGSTGYAGHNRGWVSALFLVAQRIGDREVMELALRVMAAVLAIENFLRAPADAHPTLRGKSFIPGSRCGDRRGISAARDACGEMETTGKQATKMPRPDATTIEIWMVRNAVVAGLLPKIEPGPLARPRWRLRVRFYEHGMEALFPDGFPPMPNGRPSAIAPLYGLSVDWRLPLLPDGARGGAVEWVAWDDFAERYKGSRPEGWNYPGGPLPRPLPERDLGRLLREKVIGEGAEVDRPEPPQPKPPEPPQPPPPEPPKPSEPPEPPEPKEPPTTSNEKEWRHVGLTEKGGARRSVVLRISPPDAQVELELLRIVDRKVTS